MLEWHHLWSFVIDWKDNQIDMRNNYESTVAWNQIIELKILWKYGNWKMLKYINKFKNYNIDIRIGKMKRNKILQEQVKKAFCIKNYTDLSLFK